MMKKCPDCGRSEKICREELRKKWAKGLAEECPYIHAGWLGNTFLWFLDDTKPLFWHPDDGTYTYRSNAETILSAFLIVSIVATLVFSIIYIIIHNL